jgi:hypothetical protein
MRKLYPLFVFIVLLSGNVIAQPTITSFSPASGPIGTTVTINGTNFNTTPANNIVYFGAVKASVSAASTTSLTVTVPTGATYEDFTVNVNGLIAYSSKPFVVTFPTLNYNIDSTSFALAIDSTGVGGPLCCGSGDFDGDGKPDFAILEISFNNPSLSIYRNTGISGVISFAPRIKIALPNDHARTFTISDMDGDGRLDVIINFTQDNIVSIYRNTSTPGNISFAPKVDLTTKWPYDVKISDLDGDGKPDIAVAGDSLAIFRNIGSIGTIAFTNKINVEFGGEYLAIGDLNGNGKPDIVVSNGVVSVSENLSTPGNILFAPRVYFWAGPSGYTTGVAIGDLDQDGKPDIAIANYIDTTISVFKNTYSGAIISFSPKVDYHTGSYPRGIYLNDINGDGNPDIGVVNMEDVFFSVFKNNSVSGTISFSPKIDYPVWVGAWTASLTDLDGDGKSDIAVADYDHYRVQFLRNKIGETQINSFYPTTAGTGTTVSITGLNLNGATSVTFGGVTSSSFNVISPTNISAVVSSGATGSVTVNTPYSSGSKSGFTFTTLPVVNSFIPAIGASGTVVTIKGSNFTGATTVSFGGTPAASFTVLSTTTITAVVGAGSTGYVAVTTAIGTDSLAGFSYSTTPFISSFSPLSGPIGTTVTINGANFNPVPSNNIVYFGAVKAVVSASSSTSLTVTVPIGATYEPITVTTNNKTGYSHQPFMVTFANGGYLSANSFAAKVDFTTGAFPIFHVVADFDGDGKVDVVTANNTSNSLSFFRNTSSPGIISFDPKIDYTGLNYPTWMCVGDMDGDGKLDVIVNNGYGTSVSIFKNTSTPGNISFTRTGVSSAIYVYCVAVSDLDGDGSPDLISSYGNNSTTVAIYKNSSSGGVISFLIPKSYQGGLNPGGTSTGDIDDDGRPDISLANYGYFNGTSISILRNSSSIGALSFEPKIDYTSGKMPWNIAMGDLDGDGRKDLLVANSDSAISLYNNQSTGWHISLMPKIDVATGYQNSVVMTDMDGDGKLDFTFLSLPNSVSISKNTSSIGSFSFAPKNSYGVGAGARSLSIVDIDGDGKPDIVAANGSSNTISVLRNTIGDPVINRLCPPSNSTSIPADLSGSTYQWQLNSGGSFNNINNDSYYSGVTTNTLILSNIPSAWYGYKYRCVVDGINTTPFMLKFTDTWTGVVDNAWENPANWSCGTVPDGQTDVFINAGGVVVVNSNITIATLNLNPSASLTVNPPYTLTLLGH